MLSLQQWLAVGVLAVTLVAFVLDRLRYDVVALSALVACVLLGLVKPADAFLGFGNPAVVTVAGVLVLSHALARSGAVSLAGDRIARLGASPALHIVTLCGVGAFISAFMNNVGALAIMMPIAIATARRFGYPPSLTLMPLSFATMLGGMCTLIGTPPNLLAAGFRDRYGQPPFGFFDFAPAGVAITIAGVGVLALLATRLLPRDRTGDRPAIDLFDVGKYVTEVRVPAKSAYVGKSVAAMEDAAEDRLLIVALRRGGLAVRGGARRALIGAEDELTIHADAELLQELVRKGDLELVAAHTNAGEKPELPDAGAVETAEVVVPPNAWIVGQTARGLHLRARLGVNLLALSRQGRPMTKRLRDVAFFPGDVLLLEGDADALPDAVRALGCLPLASRRIAFESFRVFAPVAVFAAAVALVAAEVVPASIAFTLGVIAMLALRLVPLRELYEGVDWPVVVLLGAMIPVGGVLESTGLAEIIAARVTDAADVLPAWGVLGVVLIATMAVTPMLNNAATVIVMAPIAIGIAQGLGVNPDAFLMAVAIGASCDFLTPFGHQNNTLILAPGGYRFADFWKLGVPLDLVVVAVALAVLPVVFPL